MIRIGKADDNDVVLDDPHVSRYHAHLIRQEGAWLLEDLSSTNGTYVNELQISKKRIVSTDRIRLGGSYYTSLPEILKSKNDYSEEFAALRNVYDRYVQAKVKIQSSNQFKIRLMQTFAFAVIPVAGMIFGLVKGLSLFFTAGFLLIAICIPTVGIYMAAKQSAKVPQLLQDLVNQFKIDYVCPKCGTFLGEIPWESLINRKYCPLSSCKAKWTDEEAS
ncbi:MAG: FHA domain-containing protein [Tannerellaceae bacterium]|jgi:hypothetical protein|nr:FHA domain-containing protein [Tannerellaceae bacterium]